MSNGFIGYKKRKMKSDIFCLFFLLIVLILFFLIISIGDKIYSLQTVYRVLSGDNIKGAGFAISRIRLPRALAAVASGMAFGIAGNTFQTMLRNPLASPDVIGVTSGTSVAAVFGILILGLSGFPVVFMGIIFGLSISLFILYLSSNKGFNPSKLILVGIGMQAFMSAITSFIIERSNEYEIANALRWLSGSLNGVQMSSVHVLFIIVFIFGSGTLMMNKYLNVLQLGEELSITLGVKVILVRAVLIVFSVILVAVTTSITGPISSVSFLASPISKKIVNNFESNVILSALSGSILVCIADLIGQNFMGIKFPVGVVTGLIGAPYLLFLLVKINKKEKGVV